MTARQRLLARAAAIILMTTPAFAGDWSGPYIGVTGGLSTVSHDGTIHQIAPPLEIPYGKDFQENLLGGVAGINIQYDKMVFGLEAAYLTAPGDTYFSGFAKYSVDQLWQAEALLRLGYDAGSVMPFIAAGPALSPIELKDYVNDPPIMSGETQKKIWGVTLGAGVEWQAAAHLRVRAEYRYTDFGDENFSYNIPGIYDQTNHFSSNAVRFSALLTF